MITRDDLLRKDKRRLDLYTRIKTLSSLAGEWGSPFEGEGSEFSEIREYQHGDDIRKIDWNTTAKMGQFFIRTYLAERDLTVMLVLDKSMSMAFSSLWREKRDVQAMVAAIIAMAGIARNNRVGYLSFTGGVEEYLPPKRGKEQFWRIVDGILSEPKERGTDFAAAAIVLERIRNTLTFVISDFMFEERAFESMRRLKGKHDVVPVIVEDRRETVLPAGKGLIRFQDIETGREYLFDGLKNSALFSKVMEEWREKRNRTLSGMGFDYILFDTTKDGYHGAIESLFKRKRMRRGSR